jgi:hypothetical protein
MFSLFFPSLSLLIFACLQNQGAIAEPGLICIIIFNICMLLLSLVLSSLIADEIVPLQQSADSDGDADELKRALSAIFCILTRFRDECIPAFALFFTAERFTDVSHVPGARSCQMSSASFKAGIVRRLLVVLIMFSASFKNVEALGVWSTAQLSVARMCPAATSVGNLAIFAGGRTGALQCRDGSRLRGF